MRRRLHLPHRLHQRIAHDNRDIRPRIALRVARQHPQIIFRQHMRRIPQMNFEHRHARMLLRQRNENPLLESSPNRRIQHPRNIRGAQHQNAIHIVANALHLHEELGFDATRRLTLVVRSRRAQRVHLVDENDARLVLTRQLEEILHQLLGFAQPLGHQIGAGHREEGGVVGLGGDRLGQVGFAGSGRLRRVPNW